MTAKQTNHIENKRIPIRNLWLLILYASKLFKTINEQKRYDVEKNPDDIPDLVAEILTHAVEYRLKQNLSVGLVRHHADLTRIRGRIDHIRTKRHSLLERGKIACSFDQFTTNTPQNLFVKAALDRLARIVKDKELKRRCRITTAALERAGVTKNDIHTTISRTSRAATLTASNSNDRQMLAAAELAFNIVLPTEDIGNSYLLTPDREGIKLSNLFEKAVGGFYDVVLPHTKWNVSLGKHLYWNEHAVNDERILPGMVVDIMLEKTNTTTQTKSRIIIDTKFQDIVSENEYGKTIFKSSNIYQIYAYLRSQERKSDPPSLTSTGILLHPSLGKNVDKSVTIQGHKIRFATVDLATNTADIRKRLLELVEC